MILFLEIETSEQLGLDHVEALQPQNQFESRLTVRKEEVKASANSDPIHSRSPSKLSSRMRGSSHNSCVNR